MNMRTFEEIAKTERPLSWLPTMPARSYINLPEEGRAVLFKDPEWDVKHVHEDLVDYVCVFPLNEENTIIVYDEDGNGDVVVPDETLMNLVRTLDGYEDVSVVYLDIPLDWKDVERLVDHYDGKKTFVWQGEICVMQHGRMYCYMY